MEHRECDPLDEMLRKQEEELKLALDRIMSEQEQEADRELIRKMEEENVRVLDALMRCDWCK